MKAPLLASHGEEGTVRGQIEKLLPRRRGELFLAPQNFPSPPRTRPLPSKRAHNEQKKCMDSSRRTVWRERVPRLSWSHRSAGFHQRGEPTRSSGQGGTRVQENRQEQRKAPADGVYAPPDRHRQDVLNCRSVCRGMQAPAIRRSCRRSERMERCPPLGVSIVTCCRASMRQAGHGRGCTRLQTTVPFASKLCPRNAKRPPCGGLCILFPRPARTGHGHRNYSALSALAGASVLASGRRVSSMMAMGALSPLRGMASFITRV